jgi:hypothetical protein
MTAELLRPGQELSFRGSETARATVTKSGGLLIDGTEYKSPSTAAKAVNGGVATNGWLAWYGVEGDVRVSLDNLRTQFTEQRSV